MNREAKSLPLLMEHHAIWYLKKIMYGSYRQETFFFFKSHSNFVMDYTYDVGNLKDKSTWQWK